jgi:hypothetical protein
MKFTILAFAAVCLLGFTTTASANVIVEYTALISEEDIYSGKGDRLRSIAAIIQQDRANVHKYGNPDDDSVDRYFRSAARRAEIPAMIKRAVQEIAPRVKAGILAGNIQVSISVQEDINGDPFMLIEEA